MGRVINTESPGKERNQWRRTVAEALRHLISKKELDEEAKDLAALVVIGLRRIAQTIEKTVEPWENRNYYLKADRFRLDWEWAEQSAGRMAATIKEDRWADLPPQLAELLPRFADIRVAKLMRSPATWEGCYNLLMKE